MTNYIKIIPVIIYMRYSVNVIGLPLYWIISTEKYISKSLFHK